MTNSLFARRLSLLAIACGAVILASRGAFASLIPIDNSSFENPVQSIGGWSDHVVAGWVATGTSGVWNPPSTRYVSVPNGFQVGYVQNGGSVSQTLTVTLQPNTTYTLSIAGGRSLYEGNNPSSDYKVQLLAGGTVLKTLTDPTSLEPGAWQTLSVTYSSGSSVAPNSKRNVDNSERSGGLSAFQG